MAHLGLTGPRWAPCWPHELCYLGRGILWIWCHHTLHPVLLLYILMLQVPVSIDLLSISAGQLLPPSPVCQHLLPMATILAWLINNEVEFSFSSVLLSLKKRILPHYICTLWLWIGLFSFFILLSHFNLLICYCKSPWEAIWYEPIFR